MCTRLGNAPQEKAHNNLQDPPWNASFQKKITKRVHGFLFGHLPWPPKRPMTLLYSKGVISL